MSRALAAISATCGTAFTPDQAKLIRRGAPNVVLLFDGDKAGLKAAVRSADVALRAGLEPKIVALPDGKDPADVVIGDGELKSATLGRADENDVVTAVRFAFDAREAVAQWDLPPGGDLAMAASATSVFPAPVGAVTTTDSPRSMDSTLST